MNSIIIILIALNAIYIFRCVKKRNFFASPHYTIFMLGYVFYMLLFPTLYSFGLIPFEYAVTLLFVSVCISTCGLVAFNIGYSLVLLPTRKLNNIRNFRDGLVNFGFGYVAIALIFIPWSLFWYSDVLHLAFVNYSIITMGLLVFCTSCNLKKYNIFIFCLILVFVFFMTIETTSGRRDLLSVFLIWYTVFVNLHRRSKSSDVIIAPFVFIIAFVGMIYITFARSFGGEVTLTSDLSIVLSDYRGVLGSLLALADFGIAYDNFLQIIENIPRHGYVGLQSFYKIFLVPIPRELLPNKPLDVQQLIVDTGYARNLYAGGSSQSTTLIGEFYWNFGAIAVFIGMLLFGYYTRLMDNLFFKRSPLLLLISLMMLPFTFLAWRGAFTTSLVYCAINAIIAILYFSLIFLFVNMKKLKCM